MSAWVFCGFEHFLKLNILIFSEIRFQMSSSTTNETNTCPATWSKCPFLIGQSGSRDSRDHISDESKSRIGFPVGFCLFVCLPPKGEWPIRFILFNIRFNVQYKTWRVIYRHVEHVLTRILIIIIMWLWIILPRRSWLGWFRTKIRTN